MADKITIPDSDFAEHEEARFHDELLDVLSKIAERPDSDLRPLLEQNLKVLRETSTTTILIDATVLEAFSGTENVDVVHIESPITLPPIISGGSPARHNYRNQISYYPYSREDARDKIKEAEDMILAATIKREDEELVTIFQCLLTAYKN